MRPFVDEDRLLVLALLNHDQPPQRQETLAQWFRRDAEMRGTEVYQRWVVGTPAVAFLEVMDMGTAHVGWRSIKGICEMEMTVAPVHRHQGIGTALYNYALDFARQRNAHTLRCWFTQITAHCPLLTFLRTRGFVQQAGRQMSQLDLATFDPTPFNQTLEQLAARSLHILNYADLDDSIENRHKLFELRSALQSITPGESFAAWAAQHMEGRNWAESLLLIAELNGQWIGLSAMEGIAPGSSSRHEFTGTLEEYRGQGIATALKLRAYEIAAARSCRFITTANRFDNSPMLAINRKLGFVATATEWTYDKSL